MRLATGWLRLRAYSKTNSSQFVVSAISFLRENTAEAGEADRKYQDGDLEDDLRPGRRAENGKTVEADGDDEHADERAEDVELAVTQGGRAEEHRGERGQEVAVGGARRPAPKPRRQQNTGDRRADTGCDEA